MPSPKQWQARKYASEKALLLEQELSLSPVLARLLVQRGIDTVVKARQFFDLRREDLLEPLLLSEMVNSK